jgi:hypothetical protein
MQNLRSDHFIQQFRGAFLLRGSQAAILHDLLHGVIGQFHYKLHAQLNLFLRSRIGIISASFSGNIPMILQSYSPQCILYEVKITSCWRQMKKNCLMHAGKIPLCRRETSI